MTESSVVHAERLVDCPFSIAAEHAADALRELEAGTGGLIVRVPLKAVGLPLPGTVRHRVRLTFGIHSFDQDNTRRGHDEIRFTWRAQSRWLPDLAGTLSFTVASHRATRLTLEGAYQPPLGLSGTLFDAVLGWRFAAATAADLVARVSAAMESAERAFRAAHPMVP